MREYVKIFSEHGIAVAEDEVRKVSQLANENGEVEKGDFLHYAKTSDFFRQQENLRCSYFSNQQTYTLCIENRSFAFLRKI